MQEFMQEVAGLTDGQLLQKLPALLPAHPVHSYSHHWSLNRTHVLLSSALLACPPTWKEYRAHIGVRPASHPGSMRLTGEFEFIGFTTYGSYDGHNHGTIIPAPELDTPIKKVNATLAAKLRKGYQPQDEGITRFTRSSVMAALERRLCGEALRVR